MDEYGFRFRDWDIYKDALNFRREVGRLLKKYPREEIYSLVDQTKRALNSIILNIAEGANKSTDKDTRLYINRAHGSLDEVVSCTDCSLQDEYISQTEHGRILLIASSLGKRLKGFAIHLSKPVANRGSVNRQ